MDTYRVDDETTVGEALFVVNGAADISLTCHIDDTDALIADLNAAIIAEQVAQAA